MTKLEIKVKKGQEMTICCQGHSYTGLPGLCPGETCVCPGEILQTDPA